MRLLANMDAVWADELIREGKAGDLPATELRRVVLLATGSEEVAQRVASKKAMDQLTRGERPQ